MNKYEVEPVAEKAWELLKIMVGKFDKPIKPANVQECFDIADEFYRQGVKRGWIKMDPQPQEKQ